MSDAIACFVRAMRARHLTIPAGGIVADGELHRCDVDGPHGKNDGAYVLHLDGLPAGGFENHRDGGGWQKWKADIGRPLTRAERDAHRRRVEDMRRKREAEQARRHAEAAALATVIWREAGDAAGHQYLARKGIGAHGTRQIDAAKLAELGGHVALSGPLLVVPMRGADGAWRGLQFIDDGGGKRFLIGTAKVGAYYGIGGKPGEILCIAEGVSTAASVHQATGWPVAVAFDAGNLRPVAEALRVKFPTVQLVIAGDNDESGTGQRAAHEAAQAVGGVVAIPPNGGEDWNDAAKVRGIEAVRAEIEAALAEPRVTKDGPKGRPGSKPKQQGEAVDFPDPTLWPEAVNGASLLSAVSDIIGRFAVMSEAARDLIALWVAHTFLFAAFDHSPRLVFSSAEKRSGKSTALNLISRLCRRALKAESMSPASLFRLIAKFAPTLLLDEADAWVRENEELRGLLNAGFEIGGKVYRVEGEAHEPRAFDVYAPVALASIGRLPATIMDRAFVVRMKRRRADETCESFRRRKHGPLFADLQSKLARWVADNGEALASAEPAIPDELNDRQGDIAEPLLAIADAAGADWPERARTAISSLCASEAEGDGSHGLRLLADIRAVFEARAVDRIASVDLAAALTEIEDAPWPTWAKGKPITAPHIAKLLKPYSISPGTVRIGTTTPKGYSAEQFADAFERYLAPSRPQSRNTATNGGLPQSPRCGTDPSRNTAATPKPAEALGCGVWRQNSSGEDVSDNSDGAGLRTGTDDAEVF